ncbi:RNA pseudouridylate synthase domain-containing protein 4-like [Mizuhopecten yessoensis]|uniref:RNA pseudouridylate synthase domain-containing protein 4 n=1 Tax=Mizuhopecten yessoensis TaxID=6573 RepID=A0A210PDZ2_MIZYE|nr:RNA pseudouridylate synthase domain-containing protein 4-like [Mizuhopecten yessoensis]XP_021343997.1 RNA pseudouridylate synthase domain-containing protein 4-like [Mizuhopecten yessoensis]OWF34671.1 RNA pseudouridylate synthase domain-containing protein 4 [Mizuhopecten yessoensis]
MASMKTSSCCLRTYSMMRHVHRISKLQDVYTPVRCVETASQQPYQDRNSLHAPVFAEKELLIEHIQKSVVYDDENILALNKPSGVPIKALHGEGVPSMADILEDLRECFDTPELEYMLGLSRNQSGIILLSKHALAKVKLKRSLQGARSYQDINHEFVCVCLGEPKFKTEVEKVRYLRNNINGRQQAVLVPHFSRYMKKGLLSSFNVKADVLATSPLETTPKVSLVGITCDSGKKECLEMYMAEHLSPILGDHVYSHRVITVAGVAVKNDQNAAIRGPQVIPTEVKHKLNVPPGVHAHLVPLHLHRSGLILKRFPHKKSESFLIEAPLPEYFADTMVKLELQPYDQDADELNQEQYSE